TPFRRKVLDREVDLYPIRGGSGVVHPAQDLFLGTGVGFPHFVLSRTNGTEQRQLHQFPPNQKPVGLAFENPGAGLNWSRDGEWIVFSQGGSALRPDSEVDIWKMRADGSEL